MTRIEESAAGVPPKEEKASGVRRMVEDIREFMRLSNVHGGLVPLSVVATVLGVSRQRVHQLVAEGTFSHWDFYGLKWMSQKEVLSFAQLDRRQGENQYKPSAKQIWKASREAGKEFVDKRRGRNGP